MTYSELYNMSQKKKNVTPPVTLTLDSLAKACLFAS